MTSDVIRRLFEFRHFWPLEITKIKSILYYSIGCSLLLLLLGSNIYALIIYIIIVFINYTFTRQQYPNVVVKSLIICFL